MSTLVHPSTPPAPIPPLPDWRRDGPRFALGGWFVATFAMMAAGIPIAIVVALTATVPAALEGERSGERFGEIARDAFGTPAFVWSTLIATQLALLACAWFACRVLRKPAIERLGLVATGLRRGQVAALVLATAVPFALGLVAATLVTSVVGPTDSDVLGLRRMWSEGSRGSSAAWILLVALVPGFVEEVFYRGFLQRGLLQRWSPAASILTSSVLFAAVHGDLAWAAFVLPLGVWFGIVAWRTGSVWLTFVMHAGMNGAWTAGMMILHRDPASEPVLNGIAIAILALGLLALPFAVRALRRARPDETPRIARGPRWALPRVAAAAVAAGSLAFVFVPPGAERTPEPTAIAAGSSDKRTSPTLAELEAGVTDSAACSAFGSEGAVDIVLVPGAGTRIALPANRAGIEDVIVTLGGDDQTVWLAYGGEHSGKGVKGRPIGIVEQLAAGQPTTLCMTLAEGPAPVKARITLEEDEERKVALFALAQTDGWALRGRK